MIGKKPASGLDPGCAALLAVSKHAGRGGISNPGRMFTIWTLTGASPLRVELTDSRAAWRTLLAWPSGDAPLAVRIARRRRGNGMPEQVRASGGHRGDPWHDGFAGACVATVAVLTGTSAAQADSGPPEVTLIDAYWNAFASLERHEVAALALALGVICFA